MFGYMKYKGIFLLLSPSFQQKITTITLFIIETTNLRV